MSSEPNIPSGPVIPVPMPSRSRLPSAAPSTVWHAHGPQWHLVLAALGVVFGDIGTSPLYTLRECMTGEHGVVASPANVLGVLSLVFWALTMVVTVKYLTFIMRADNKGEGGILALLALLPKQFRDKAPGKVGVVPFLVLMGAALLYGDGIITPAVSVLSAIEGIEVATPKLSPVVVPITCVIILGLFAIQRHGTGRVGRLFGPVMGVWFVTIAGLGVVQIARNPSILMALSPVYALDFFEQNGWHAFRLLGSVVLAVTGGEALYADMGHFGVHPIRKAWLVCVFPALVLAYFGQGAIVLAHPEAAASPFYAMVPSGIATYGLVVLATAATVIASQALISGSFSLTNQAVQLGYFPRVEVRHTSREAEGQIYIPEINWGLAIMCIALVLQFKKSTNLAAAYGIAVSGTMAITSVVFFVVSRYAWKWPLWRAVPLLALFLAVDLPFLGANALKFADGGWVPVLVGAVILIVMVDWKIGRSLLASYYASQGVNLTDFLATLDQRIATRVPGGAVFMASNATGVPPVMVHHAKRIRTLHEVVVLLTVVFEHVPAVEREERLSVAHLGKGVYRVMARFGFMQTPDVPELLEDAIEEHDLPIKLHEVTYYLGRETFTAQNGGRMRKLSEALFSFLSKNARPATRYFSIPSEQVVEIGTQIDL